MDLILLAEPLKQRHLVLVCKKLLHIRSVEPQGVFKIIDVLFKFGIQQVGYAFCMIGRVVLSNKVRDVQSVNSIIKVCKIEPIFFFLVNFGRLFDIDHVLIVIFLQLINGPCIFIIRLLSIH